jgi:large subunit ribosomal protein L15
MQAHQLKRNNPNRKTMIVARGGKRGKTAGRGGKGQSARAGNKRRPEWRDIIKKFPKLRGRGVNPNKPISEKFFPVNVGRLETEFENGANITPSVLLEKGIVELRSGNIPRIKILGGGELKKAFNISGCVVSKSAKEMIEKAKGKVQ